MIPSLLADRVAYVAIKEAIEQRAEKTTDLYFLKHRLQYEGESIRPAFDRASHALAKAEGYLNGVMTGLGVRYDSDDIRQFIVAASSELGDSGIVREGQ